MRNLYLFIFIVFIVFVSCNQETKQALNSTESKGEKKAEKTILIDSVETLIGRTAIKDLEYFSSSFIRYSRNQYFAKKDTSFKTQTLYCFSKIKSGIKKTNLLIPFLIKK